MGRAGSVAANGSPGDVLGRGVGCHQTLTKGDTTMSDSTLIIVGNLTKDPTKRSYKEDGEPAYMVQLSVASSKRMRNFAGEWDSGPTTFVDVSCWGKLAENALLTLGKGMSVIVYGRLDQNKWKTDEGQNRSQLRVHAITVGPDLRKFKGIMTKTPFEAKPNFGGTGAPDSADANVEDRTDLAHAASTTESGTGPAGEDPNDPDWLGKEAS